MKNLTKQKSTNIFLIAFIVMTIISAVLLGVSISLSSELEYWETKSNLLTELSYEICTDFNLLVEIHEVQTELLVRYSNNTQYYEHSIQKIDCKTIKLILDN